MAKGINRADAAAGVLLTLAGSVFGAQSLGLEIGTALRMGPGYFPLVLAVILMLLGLLILAAALRTPGEPTGATAWRGMMFILPAPIVFGLTVRGLGFVPSVFLTTLVAAMASARMRILPALALALAVTVFCTLVFSYGLGLPFQRFGPWVRF